MSWIKMRTSLRTHPKVVRIASALKADILRTIGGLYALWSVLDDHSDDGKLIGYTCEIMDGFIGWPGFCAAVADVDWLLVNDNSLIFPEFETHNSKSAKRRANDSVRKMSAREADKKRTREEEIREDIYKPPLSPKGEKRKSDKFDLSTLVYPAPLDTPKWEEWLENRKTLGKRVTLIAAKKQLAFLAGYTLEQQRIIIDQSIMNGYTGLFPPKGGFNGQAGSGSGSHPRPDNSAAGRVRANIARDRAADAARAGQMAMANDELHVRPQVGEQLRGRSGPGQGMGVVFEGDFERSD